MNIASSTGFHHFSSILGRCLNKYEKKPAQLLFRVFQVNGAKPDSVIRLSFIRMRPPRINLSRRHLRKLCNYIYPSTPHTLDDVQVVCEQILLSLLYNTDVFSVIRMLIEQHSESKRALKPAKIMGRLCQLLAAGN